MFVCVRCVRVWLRALCHLSVCVWVPPVRRTHDSLNIPDKFYNYFDNLTDSLSIPNKLTFTIIICILFRPWMVVSFKTVEYQSHCDILSKLHSFKRSSIIAIQSLFDYFISLTPFKVIPDPFQSLNTKGSIFKDNFNMLNVIYYFISLTIFKAIPDLFQSLNTKGSIFKDYFNMFNVIYYFISLTIFKAIPAPFQSLNTRGSVFKVSLQTYIYIIVIYTTTNKFVWTRMLIFFK
ncbi:hypothetical protein DVH24_017817 [Malus domestica]|uniref:Uncharacterized protein n=1 Tax=Malus domestica TaxID=3750 RepID=A0A498KJ46_MALDO|nr:hypothetical protein DVH24_017817 [Malus domestica]